MAVVKNPFLSTDARGSLGGMTASVVRGGKVLKAKSKPSRRMRQALNLVRSVMGYLSRLWGEITDEQRYEWSQYALNHPGTDKFGDPFIMSGFNAFVMLNHTAIRIFGVGEEALDPPVTSPQTSISVLTAAIGAVNVGDIDLIWTENGTGIAADKWEIQQAGPFQSKGRESVLSRFRSIDKVAGNVLLSTIAGLTEEMWYWFRVRYIDATGQVTAWQIAQQTPKIAV